MSKLILPFLMYSLYFFIFASCKQKQQPDPAAIDLAQLDSLFSIEDDRVIFGINSYTEFKTHIFRIFQKHQSDSMYNCFKTIVDTIAGGTYVAQIKIGQLFHSSLRSAVLGWSVSDTSVDIEGFHFKNGQWTPCFLAKNQPSLKFGTDLRSAFLFTKDYNFDGWNDLEVKTEAWDALDIGYKNRLWLADSTGFKYVKNFESVKLPEFDNSDSVIYSYAYSCGGGAMYFSIWKLQADSVRQIKDIDLDCCVGYKGKCLVSVDNGKKFPVPSDEVYRHVPKYYQKHIKLKMSR
jgi:hypothetical protein